MSTLERLTERGLVKPPRWLPGNVQYETIMGSVAYGVSSDTSDMDVYGWAIPPKDDHVVRLLTEVEMILMEEDIDLQRNNEQLKAIRRAEWSEEQLRKWCADKESHLERMYVEPAC